MKRSQLDANISHIQIKEGIVDIDFELVSHYDTPVQVDLKRCTFLDFAEVQSVSKEKDHIPTITIPSNEVFMLHLHFESTDQFEDTHKAAITLDLFDHIVDHHISYSYDVESLNDYELNDVYESNHNDPIFENEGGEMIMGLINQLKDTFGANVIVKEVNGTELEDLLPMNKKNKLIN